MRGGGGGGGACVRVYAYARARVCVYIYVCVCVCAWGGREEGVDKNDHRVTASVELLNLFKYFLKNQGRQKIYEFALTAHTLYSC